MFDILGKLLYETDNPDEAPVLFRTQVICAENDYNIKGLRFTLPEDIKDLLLPNISAERAREILASKDDLVDITNDGILQFENDDEDEDDYDSFADDNEDDEDYPSPAPYRTATVQPVQSVLLNGQKTDQKNKTNRITSIFFKK